MAIWPPQNTGLFEYKTPCCECGSDCFLNLPSDFTLGDVPYYLNFGDIPDSTDFPYPPAVNSALGGLALVSECAVYDSFSNNTYNSYDVTVGEGTLEIAYEIDVGCGPSPPPGPPFPFTCPMDSEQWFAISSLGGTLGVAYDVSQSGVTTGGGDFVNVTIYDSDYAIVDAESDTTQGAVTGTFSIPIPSAGKYLVRLEIFRRMEDSGTHHETVTTDTVFTLPDGTTICPAQSEYQNLSAGTAIFIVPCCAVFETRKMGGLAQCCGFAMGDFGDGPTITGGGCWKTVTVAGSVTFDHYDNSDCTGTIITTHTTDYGASCTMNDDCEITSGPCVDGPPGYQGWPQPIDVSTPGNPWVFDYDDCDGAGNKRTGEVTVTFSDPTTFAEALARLLASSPPWTDWEAVPVVALYPTAVQEGWYFDAEWRINKPGLTPSTEYTVQVQYWRRILETNPIGDWVLYQTLDVTATTDGSGVFTATDSIPNDEGFETLALCLCVFTATPP